MKFLLLTSVIIVLASCASSHVMPADERVPITHGNIQMLNGRYDNNSSDDIREYQTRLWSHLKPFPEDATYNQNAHKKIPNSFIGVKIIDDKNIRFKLFDGPTLKQSTDLKYQLADGIILIDKPPTGD